VTSAPLIVVLAVAAVWPFGRGNDDDAPTIENLDAGDVVVDTEAALEDSAAKAIESYRRFLEIAAADPALEAEAMRRLADLELESAEAAELDDGARAAAAVGDTIAMYERVLTAHPGYVKNDLVLYQLARAYEVAGRVDESLAALERLIGAYPQTEHFDEAQFRRGETLFVEKRYADAERAYTEVLRREESAFHEQALYKQGWARFKQQSYEESLAPFFALLDRKLGAAAPGATPAELVDPAVLYGEMTRAQREIVDDTLRVLSIAFSYVDGPEAISAYFAAHGTKPYAFIVYLNLGDLYLEQERYQDGADAYAAFAALDPYHAKAPLLQGEAIAAFAAGGFADLVLDEKRGFVETYGPDSPYWQRFTYAEQPEAVALLKTNVTDLASHHHAAAQSTGEPGEYAAAARWYRAYLQSFPDDAKAPETNFLLAEVLYESGEFRDAAHEYERTAYGYAAHGHGGEAGYAALLAYADEEARLVGTDRALWHRAGIDSALRFVAAYAEHESAASVATDAAEKLYALGELVLARDTAQALLERGGAGAAAATLGTTLARTARTVVAHAEFDLGNFAAAENAYLALTAGVPADDPARADFDERVASAIYKQGEEAQAAGLTEEAVEHYLRVARAAPGASIRPTADYDAAAALIQIGDWQRANAVLEEFRARFPDHALSADATAKLAVGYVEVGESARAAAEFERIADGDGTADVKREALWRAAELYSSAGQAAAAAAADARFVERQPRPAAEAIRARQRLVELAEQSGNETERRRWLQALVAADTQAGAERTDRTRYLAAHAQLALAGAARDAFRGTRLAIPLDQSLRAKQARMEEALEGFGRAADYGIAEVTTAATFEIADLYHTLSKDLFASERPADLSAEELEQYDLLLEEQAFPFEEEAIELHEVNAARTADGVYDDWVKRSLAALADLLPVRYAKTELAEPPADALIAAHAAIAGELEEQSSRRQKRKSRDRSTQAVPAAAAVPQQAAAAFARAVGAMESRDWLGAELALEEVLAAVPSSTHAHFNAALVAQADGRLDAARASLERAIELDPANVAAHDQLGVVLRAAGEFAAAENAYRRGLEVDPAHARTHYNLGVLLDLYARRPADALEHYELYQSAQDQPDERVGRWIVELKRRLGVDGAARVAREGI
jgi:tetratricopeptide (TPR) repeat protein